MSSITSTPHTPTDEGLLVYREQMVTNIELAPSGTNKLNAWLLDVAKPDLNMKAVVLDVLSTLENRACTGESLTYEMHRQHTITGNPETITFDVSDVIVATAPIED